MKCPFCKETIDDDSYYCDQCGKELRFCPDCGKPKQGTSCPACGADLVSGAAFFLKKPQGTQPLTTPSKPYIMTPPPQATAAQAPQAPQGTAVSAPPKPMPQSLSGNGWNLPLKEGVFGRTQGIYSEFSTQQYISGRHGQFRMNNGQWQVLDFGSTNGTFLNGQRLAPNSWYDLNLGDQLKIATTNFIIA